MFTDGLLCSIGVVYVGANKANYLASWSVCPNGHMACKSFNTAGEPTAEQGVVAEEAGEESGSLFFM